MFDEVVFINQGGERIDFNLPNYDPNGWLPLREVSFEMDARADDRPKMQRHGIWANSTLAGALMIHLEGDIIADTVNQINAYKLNLMRIMMPPIGGGRYANQVGTFYVKFTGAYETYQCSVGYEAFPMAITRALYPCILPFTVTFKGFNGYMVGVNTGNPYWVT